MQAVSIDTVLGALQWRYATKKFDKTKKIPAATWQALEDALVLSPSSFGLQPWRFYVISNPELRAKLTPASWNQPQIEEASHLVVFAARQNLGEKEVSSYIKRIAAVRNVPESSLDGYRQMMLGFVTGLPKDAVNTWAAKQCYIALGTFLTTAAMLGVDACPMEGIDAGKYNDILGVSADGYSVAFVAAAGYRSTEDALAVAKKVRAPKESVVIHK